MQKGPWWGLQTVTVAVEKERSGWIAKVPSGQDGCDLVIDRTARDKKA